MRAVNLIPTDRRPGAGGALGRSGGAAYAVVGLAAGIVLLAVLWLSAHHDVTQRQAQLRTLDQQASTIATGAGSLQSYSSFVSMADGRVAAVKQLAAERFDWAHAFHELGRVLPVGISLTTVTGTTGGMPASGPAVLPSAASGATGTSGAVQSATPAGDQPAMSVQGCATSQALVAQTVQRLALIDGVENVSLQSSSQSGTTGSTGQQGPCPYDFTIDVTFLPLPAVSAAASVIVPPTRAAATSPSASTAAGVRPATMAAAAGRTGATGATGATGQAATATTTVTATTRSAVR